MPYIPQIVKNSSLTSDTLNAIGQDIGLNVTVVTDNTQTLFNYAKSVLSTSSMTNAFLSSLINLFAQPELLAASYENPLKRFKKGVLEYGEGREEVWVDIAKGVKKNKDYMNPSSPIPTSVPSVLAAFHVLNVEAAYKTTVARRELNRGLTTFGGVDYLINLIVSRPRVSAEKDENTLTRLMLALLALDAIKAGKNKEVTAVSTDAKAMLKACRQAALDFEDLEKDYTVAGNYNSTKREDLTCILPHAVESIVDVEALASAFNIDKAEFLGQRVSIRDFAFKADEKERILAITGLQSWPISEAEEGLLEKVQGIVADKDILFIYDVEAPHFGDPFPNGLDESINYFWHVATSYGYSPFHNALVLTEPLTRVNITFNKNNESATGTMTQQSVVANVATALKANSYALTGYHFKEWNTAAAGTGTSYADGAQITAASNTTLYAIWEADA